MAVYEALFAGLRMTQVMKITHIKIHSDSQSVVNQTKGNNQMKEPTLAKYIELFKRLREQFDQFDI